MSGAPSDADRAPSQSRQPMAGMSGVAKVETSVCDGDMDLSPFAWWSCRRRLTEHRRTSASGGHWPQFGASSIRVSAPTILGGAPE